MIKPIFNAHKIAFNKAKALYEADIDLVLPDEPETCPTCHDDEELRALFQAMTRPHKFFMPHCTGTQLDASVSAILRYWREVNKWGEVPGYALICNPLGEWTQLASLDSITYGCRGYNSNSLHVATIGGLHVDDRTPEQVRFIELCWKYDKERWPNVRPISHNTVNPGKACPRYRAEDLG
jgi:N-acetylmuramoyl-L-alanine amidase